MIGEPRLVSPPVDTTVGRLAGQYQLLKAAVMRRLDGCADTEAGLRPVSVKGVCLDAAGRVLLCRNWRDECELPGGRPEIGERFDRSVEREILEETGVVVRAENVIDAYPFEVQPGDWLDVRVYGCSTIAPVVPTESPEHQDVGWVDPEQIAPDQIPIGYRNVIRRWRAAHAD